MELTKRQQQIFDRARSTFEGALLSDTYLKWIERAVEDFDYYESRQWSQEDLDKLAEVGLKPVTINVIRHRLDVLAGNEIKFRQRFKYRSRSGVDTEVLTAQALSGMAMWLQDVNKSNRIYTECKHKARICGLGFHSITVTNGRIKEACENPLEVVWDVRDRTEDLSNQGFIARVLWMPLEDAKRRWKGAADSLTAASVGGAMGGLGQFGFLSARSLDATRLRMGTVGGYFDKEAQEIAVVEYQYREPAKYYTYVTEEGLIAQTFDKEEAEKNASDKKAIQEEEGYKVNFVYFCGGVFLEAFEYSYQLCPDTGAFTITPFVYARSEVDGVPMGLVCHAKDPQRLLNLKQSKVNWMMIAKQVIADRGAVDNPKAAAKEINRPNAFIIKNPGKEFKIDSHGPEIAQHYQSMAIHKQEVQDTLGIYDEFLGVETNAASGVAIQRRQNAANATTLLGTDRLQSAVITIARKMLALIQYVMNNQIAGYVLDDEGQVQTMRLDQTVKGEDGKDKKAIDVKAGLYDVTVEMVPDVSSVNEEAQMKLMELATANPNILTNPLLLEMAILTFNIPMTQGIKDVLAKVQAQQQAQANQQLGQATGAPPNSVGEQPGVQPEGMSMQ